ncbi:helix-turn-helix transcriptional regulator [Acidimangrovimonas sediminis]|uniref:helix-turn-helix transcriptional regulator n=1 Tax=Acidimangrovimonas sediminis TaxID=2056283 RepID=UPI0013048B10|nr:helix-turn-helix transcriptional regulator [Acidimangrovimonas sediminis]
MAGIPMISTRRDAAGSQAAGSQAAQGTPMLLWLDVAPDGRVLSADPVTREVVGPAVHDGGVFLVEPRRAFLAALDRADDCEDPVPSVLHPDTGGDPALVQVNILPFKPGRIRIVLFVEPEALADPEPTASPLTRREHAVLELLAAGYRRDRIAWELNISLPTVDLHARNLRRKLSALTTSEAVATATRIGLVRR